MPSLLTAERPHPWYPTAMQIRQAARRGELSLPDCAGRLSVCSSCIHCSRGVQAARLLARIDPSKVRRCGTLKSSIHHLVPASPSHRRRRDTLQDSFIIERAVRLLCS